MRSALFTVLVCCACGVWAQDVSFRATVDHNPVGLDEQFTLSFVLSTSGMGGGKNIQLPDLQKFRILTGPNQSTQMQMINGAVSSSVSYSYVLQPKEVGKVTVGAGSIEVGGKVYSSEPLTVEVVKGAGRPQQQAAPAADAQVQVGDNLYLRAIADRTHVLQGEQINLSFKLYTRVKILSYGIDKSPALIGFWGEDIEIPKNIQLSVETINGKQFQVGVIKKMALFPTQSGTLEISPMELQASVQVQSRSLDPFDAFFRDPFGRASNVPVKSAAIKIVVDPLPGGAPADFKGAVGRFGLSAGIDKKTTRTNEPVTIKVTISGTGNIKLLEAPTVEFPPDFEQFPPKVNESITRGEKVSGSKTFEYLVMPRYPGLKTIPPITFSYFDLSRESYVHLHSPQIDVNVEQGAAVPPPIITGSGREDVRLLSQDIRFIKVGTPTFVRSGNRLHTQPVFYVLVLVPLALFGGTMFFIRKRMVIMADGVGYRNRQALKVARQGLKEAEFLLKIKGNAKDGPATNQKLRFYAETSKALWKYLSDKLNIPPADLSVEGTLRALQERGVDKGLAAALKSLMETCDMARFSPSSLGMTQMQKAYDEARRIIMALEQTFK
jgi:hypothetical protein